MNKPYKIDRSAGSTSANRRSSLYRAFVFTVMLGSCGCAHTLESKFPKFNHNARGQHSATPSVQSQVTATPRNAQQTAQQPAQSTAQPAGRNAVATARTASISDKTSPSQAAPGNVVAVSYQEPMADSTIQSNVDPSCIDQSGAACATGDNGGNCNTACAPQMPCEPLAEGVPQYWNDQEYLYDGGDRDPRVVVTEDWRVHGLNSQDTVAHYETIEGKLCVTPSNRVPIYAPRFGAVRKTTAPTLSAGAVGARGMLDPQGAVVKTSNEPVGDLAMPRGPKLRDAVAPIDSLRDRTRGVGTEKILPAIDLSGYQVALRKMQSVGSSLRREDLWALMGEYMVNARTWTSPEGLSVAISGVAAVQVRDAKEVQDVTLYETEPGKCSLRICKAASHSAANPGDIINFSIRFDNIGNKPIGNLVILDSLVSRLEYIDGSQQCLLSLASNKSPDKEKESVKFSTAENEAGSTVLRWEIDLPLETADSGVITFRCRVR